MAEARVHLRVDNVSRVPSGLLMLQDRVPYVLGPRPRFVLDRVRTYESDNPREGTAHTARRVCAARIPAAIVH